MKTKPIKFFLLIENNFDSIPKKLIRLHNKASFNISQKKKMCIDEPDLVVIIISLKNAGVSYVC